jgi:hypothetical protein
MFTVLDTVKDIYIYIDYLFFRPCDVGMLCKRNNINTDCDETVDEDVEWIHLAWDRIQR